MNQTLVIHTISGSFWTVLHMLQNMDQDWKDTHVKAIVFDSCPLTSDIYAFGGWLAFMLKRHKLKPYISPLFYPYIWYSGITEKKRQNWELLMLGNTSVIPRQADILFLCSENDPVMSFDYYKNFVQDVKLHQSADARVLEKVFVSSRHSLALVDSPTEYKETLENEFLSKVPEWKP